MAAAPRSIRTRATAASSSFSATDGRRHTDARPHARTHARTKAHARLPDAQRPHTHVARANDRARTLTHTPLDRQRVASHTLAHLLSHTSQRKSSTCLS
eukprot:6157638-Pleurochrysis_carterae.AAC.1